MLENSESKLLIEIKNKRPIELMDLTESMNGLGVQYNRFLTERGGSSSSSKLYVREMRTGSVIIELMEMLPATAMFANLENYNNVIDFAKHLQSVYNFFRGTSVSDSPMTVEATPYVDDFSVSELRNYSSIVEPVAKDNGSIVNISGEFNNSPVVVLNIPHADANVIQNEISRLIKDSKESISGFRSNVVFYWHTIKSNSKTKTGDKGIIEALSLSPVKIMFSSDQTKKVMAFMENENPMLMGYVVDVDVQTIQGKPVLYNILKVHSTI
jgi:hypothetical protein